MVMNACLSYSSVVPCCCRAAVTLRLSAKCSSDGAPQPCRRLEVDQQIAAGGRSIRVRRRVGKQVVAGEGDMPAQVLSTRQPSTLEEAPQQQLRNALRTAASGALRRGGQRLNVRRWRRPPDVAGEAEAAGGASHGSASIASRVGFSPVAQPADHSRRSSSPGSRPRSRSGKDPSASSVEHARVAEELGDVDQQVLAEGFALVIVAGETRTQ